MNTFRCLSCNKENTVKRNHANKFCNNTCQQDFKFKEDTLPRFLKGEISLMRTIHRCLKFLHGYKCQLCSNEGVYNGKPLSLQIDHIDGKASNNNPSNLRLLCPNCHSQTETFVARNKGKSTRVR